MLKVWDVELVTVVSADILAPLDNGCILNIKHILF